MRGRKRSPDAPPSLIPLTTQRQNDHAGHVHIATNVAALKARLSEFLRQVKGGNDMIVAERGVPIARLTGLDPLEQRAARRVRLARAGVLALGSGKRPAALHIPPRGEPVGRDVLDALLAERAESRLGRRQAT